MRSRIQRGCGMSDQVIVKFGVGPGPGQPTNPVAIELPADVTPSEALAIVAALAQALDQVIARQGKPRLLHPLP